MEGGGGREEPHSNETQHYSPLQCHFKSQIKAKRGGREECTTLCCSEKHPPFHTAAGRLHPGITIAPLLTEN